MKIYKSVCSNGGSYTLFSKKEDAEAHAEAETMLHCNSLITFSVQETELHECLNEAQMKLVSIRKRNLEDRLKVLLSEYKFQFVKSERISLGSVSCIFNMPIPGRSWTIVTSERFTHSNPEVLDNLIFNDLSNRIYQASNLGPCR